MTASTGNCVVIGDGTSEDGNRRFNKLCLSLPRFGLMYRLDSITLMIPYLFISIVISFRRLGRKRPKTGRIIHDKRCLSHRLAGLPACRRAVPPVILPSRISKGDGIVRILRAEGVCASLRLANWLLDPAEIGGIGHMMMRWSQGKECTCHPPPPQSHWDEDH